MDNVLRTFSDRDVQDTGDTSSGTVTTFDADVGLGGAIASLEAARQERNNRDLNRWVGSVLPAIREFCRLPEGWDTYNGKPLQLDTGMFALTLLTDIMNPRVPIPIAGPTSPGGVQFEWHQGRFDLELTINAPYDCDLYFRDHVTGEQDSYQITTDFSPLTRLIRRMQAVNQAAA